MGQLKDSPFPVEAVENSGFPLGRNDEDRTDTKIDFRFMDQVMRAARDPDGGVGRLARRVKFGPGVRLPRLPALYRPKRRWKLAGRGNPDDHVVEDHDPVNRLEIHLPDGLRTSGEGTRRSWRIKSSVGRF